MYKGLASLSAATAATKTLDKPRHRLILSNAGAAVVYAIINWKAADTEVSATVFNFFIKAGDILFLDFGDALAERIDNLRLISASTAVVGILAE